MPDVTDYPGMQIHEPYGTAYRAVCRCHGRTPLENMLVDEFRKAVCKLVTEKMDRNDKTIDPVLDELHERLERIDGAIV